MTSVTFSFEKRGMRVESDVEDDYTSDGFENSTVRVLFSSLTEVIVFVFRFESFPSKPCNLAALIVPGKWLQAEEW